MALKKINAPKIAKSSNLNQDRKRVKIIKSTINLILVGGLALHFRILQQIQTLLLELENRFACSQTIPSLEVLS